MPALVFQHEEKSHHLKPAPFASATPVLDALLFREPDLSVYDQLVATPMTRDSGNPPTAGGGDHEEA